MNKPFFSVVIPVYNKEPHIARAINSVLVQTFTNFEIIIICDPSTDNSNVEVKKFSDPRIKVFHRTEPGPGGYATRNLGIQESKGEWVAFLDADDEWYPEHLFEMHELSIKYPDIHVLISARAIEKDGGERLDKFSETLDDESKLFSFKDYLVYALKYEHPFHANVIKIKRDIAKNHFSFPAGRAKRSGDLYAWVMLAFTVKQFAWTATVGSVLHKDVIGVSKTAVPSMFLNHDMVNELKKKVSVEELFYLKKYANRLMRTAFFEQNRVLGKMDKNLFSAFYWTNDLKFCCFWACYSLLPLPIRNIIKKSKKI